MTHIAIIGTGKMGGAFYRGLAQAFSENDLIVCDTSAEQLAKSGAAHATQDPNEALRDADVMLIAVKPQSFDDLRKSIIVSLQGKLVISIMAGVLLEIVQDAARSKSVIRAMPNLGAQVGRSITAWIASSGCSKEQKTMAQKIFGAIGQEMEVRDEKIIDAFTALAGSGPAYFFYLTELLAAKAVAMGFDKEQAHAIAREVLGASAGLLDTDAMTAKEWKKAVTSPGGTTEAALRVLQEKGFEAVFFEAIDAARKRSEELSRG